MKSIREVNDEIRSKILTNPYPHRVVLTRGVSGLPKNSLFELLTKVKEYNTFDKSNDPYLEHDFGSLLFKGIKYFWKFDYFDKNFEFFEENGFRVLTLMEASEY